MKTCDITTMNLGKGVYIYIYIHIYILLCIMICGILPKQHNNKNKQIKLFTLVSFNNCYMFQSTFRTIFRQFH
jgi:hypothetical protein